MSENDYITYFSDKYNYISHYDLLMTYRLAKEKIINTLYPFRDDVNEVPQKYEMKVIEVMEELIETSNMRHFTSYSENGWKWERPDAGLQTYAKINSMGL